MSWLLLLCCIILHLKFAFATSIIFTSYSALSTITQICTSGGYHDICCTPLDLNLNDGHGYGWFIASTAAFVEIESASTVTAIYGTGDQRPCHTHIIKSERGNRAWQAEIRESGGAGSASVVSTFRPLFLRKRLPDRVLFDNLEYEYVETGTGGVRSFMNEDGAIIHGKPWEITRLSRYHNDTRSAAHLNGTWMNRSTS